MGADFLQTSCPFLVPEVEVGVWETWAFYCRAAKCQRGKHGGPCLVSPSPSGLASGQLAGTRLLVDLTKKAIQNLDNWEVMHMHIVGVLIFARHLGVECGVLGIAKYIGFQLPW